MMMNLDSELDLYQFNTQKHDNIYLFHGKLASVQPGKTYKVGRLAADNEKEIIGAGISTVEVPEGKTELSFYDLLVLEKQPQSLRFYVRDEETGDGSLFERNLSIEEGFVNLSSLVVFQGDGEPVVPLIHDGKALHIDRKDFYSKKEPIWVLVYLEGLDRPFREYQMSSFIEEGDQWRPGNLDIVDFQALDDHNYRALAYLDPKTLTSESKNLVFQPK